MRRMKRVFMNKRGLTLVELMVTLSIMAIVVVITIIMLLSSSNLFAQHSGYAAGKQIGDGCLDYVAEQLLYANSVSSVTDTSGEGHMLLVSEDGQNPAALGYLYQKSGVMAHVFSEEFYNGNFVKIKLKSEGQSSVLIAVHVVRRHEGSAPYAEETVYKNEKSIRLLNAIEENALNIGALERDLCVSYSVPLPG